MAVNKNQAKKAFLNKAERFEPANESVHDYEAQHEEWNSKTGLIRSERTDKLYMREDAGAAPRSAYFQMQNSNDDNGDSFDQDLPELEKESSSRKRIDSNESTKIVRASEKVKQRDFHAEDEIQLEHLEDPKFRHNVKKLQTRKGYEQAHGTTYSRSGKLHFDDERNGMIRGTGTGILRGATGFISMAATSYAADMLSDETDDSAGSDALEMGSRFAARSVNVAFNGSINRNRLEKRYRLQSRRGRDTFFYDTEPLSAQMNHFWQKKRYKDAYRESAGAFKTTEKITAAAGGFAKKVAVKAGEISKANSHILAVIGIIGMVLMLIASSVSSCSYFAQGISAVFTGSTYPSSDSDINKTEAAYASLESQLDSLVFRMETSHPGYDEYRYQIDEIFHNPYQLISLLTTLYGEFTYSQIKETGILQRLFDSQYSIGTYETTETTTEIVEITDPDTGETVEEEQEKEIRILNITLRNHGFDTVARSFLPENGSAMYTLLNNTYGNRSYLFDLEKIRGFEGIIASSGSWYQIPQEALSDARFARMIREAEKYLGYPYVWGGSSPGTSFDCSGFVCWVVNHCGNGWNVGRTTAEGLRSYCAYVPKAQARPGDLIFFQGTYNTAGASHIGIYVGDGMMIHCGNPIQYTSINTSYWQAHFMAFGRLHN